MVNPSKSKGTAAETAVVRYLHQWSTHVERRALSGSADKGDVSGVLGAVVEIKACKAMELSQWIKEADVERENAGASLAVVWHKRRGKSSPADWFVTMTGADFVHLLIEAGRLIVNASSEEGK